MLKSEQEVPCGRCLHCLKARASAWSFRLMEQAKVSKSAYFLTLTYAPGSAIKSSNGFLTLWKRDLQLFFKRLRKRQDAKKSELFFGESISYYAVGEYGGKLGRPHYHIILFNADLREVIGSREFDFAVRFGWFDGKRHFFCNEWKNGHITVGLVSWKSCGYVLKYVVKGAWRPKHERDDREKEFCVMSKGLGLEYISLNIWKWYAADKVNRLYASLDNGAKIRLPRYFRDKIFTREELEEAQAACVARVSGNSRLESEVRSGYEYRKAMIKKQFQNKYYVQDIC